MKWVLVGYLQVWRGFELGTTKNKSSKWPEQDSNLGPPHCESDAVTTQPGLPPDFRLGKVLNGTPLLHHEAGVSALLYLHQGRSLASQNSISKTLKQWSSSNNQ